MLQYWGAGTKYRLDAYFNEDGDLEFKDQDDDDLGDVLLIVDRDSVADLRRLIERAT